MFNSNEFFVDLTCEVTADTERFKRIKGVPLLTSMLSPFVSIAVAVETTINSIKFN